MRLIFMALFTLIFIFALSLNQLFATSVEMPEIYAEEKEMARAVTFDFIYSRTFERELKAPTNETDDIESMDQGHLKISYTNFEQVQPYLKLGVSQLEEKIGNVNIAGLGRRDVKFEYAPDFSYGVGVDGAIGLPIGLPIDFFIGYDLQYLRSKHELDKVLHKGETASSKTGETLLEEWHGAIFLAKKFALGQINETLFNLIPYIGARYSDLELEIKKDIEYTVSEGNIVATGKSQADKNFGAFAGVLLNIRDNWRLWRLHLEGRFFDETAATFSVSYKF